MTTKYCGKDPAKMKKFNRNQEKNYIVHNAVDEIILQKNNTLSVEDKTHDNIDHEIDEDYLYEIENIILDENKENK